VKRLCAVMIVGAIGCATDPPPVCVLAATMRTRSPMRAADWYRLLVDRALDGSAADCTGAKIEWRAPEGCQEPADPSSPLPGGTFGDADLVISQLPNDEQLVWTITQRFDDGDGLGPVGWVRKSKDGPQVIATGSLRARTKRARLSLASLGPARLLVADGERCPSADPSSCERALSLLVLRDRRFKQTMLSGENGACLGPAEIHLTRRQVTSLATGWKRRFELNSTVSYDKERWTVQENVVVSDRDPSGSTPHVDRRADAERTLRVQGDRLIASDTSLWFRMVSQGAER